MTRARILFLSANPASTSRLALDEEVRAIQVRLRQSGAAERIEICTEWALRAEELPAALMRHRPQIVHFSGHGSSAGELFLSAGTADESNDISPIKAETLRRIFEPLTGDICCVVLNACYSAVQAQTLAEILPCVVGMTSAMPDRAAITFAAGFYETLAFGESIQTALKLGCTQIELAQASGQNDIPKILLRPGTDAAQLRPFAPATPGPAAPAAAAKETSASSNAVPSHPARIGVAVAMVLTLLLSGAGAIWWRSTHKIQHQQQHSKGATSCGTLMFHDVVPEVMDRHVQLDLRLRNESPKDINITRAAVQVLKQSAARSAYVASANYDIKVENPRNETAVGHLLHPGEVESFILRLGFSEAYSGRLLDVQVALRYDGNCVLTSDTIQLSTEFLAPE